MVLGGLIRQMRLSASDVAATRRCGGPAVWQALKDVAPPQECLTPRSSRRATACGLRTRPSSNVRHATKSVPNSPQGMNASAIAILR
jgi:hypothetical protein